DRGQSGPLLRRAGGGISRNNMCLRRPVLIMQAARRNFAEQFRYSRSNLQSFSGAHYVPQAPWIPSALMTFVGDELQEDERRQERGDFLLNQISDQRGGIMALF